MTKKIYKPISDARRKQIRGERKKYGVRVVAGNRGMSLKKFNGVLDDITAFYADKSSALTGANG